MIYFQGDVLFMRGDAIPKDAKEVPRVNGALVAAHSETGHHHSIRDIGATMYADPNDATLCYLRLEGPVTVEHMRPFDTHAPITFGECGEVWKVRRQREHTPEGWRMVQD